MLSCFWNFYVSNTVYVHVLRSGVLFCVIALNAALRANLKFRICMSHPSLLLVLFAFSPHTNTADGHCRLQKIK